MPVEGKCLVRHPHGYLLPTKGDLACVALGVVILLAFLAFCLSPKNKLRKAVATNTTLALELGPQLDETCFLLRRNRPAKVQENLEGGGTRLIEELDAA